MNAPFGRPAHVMGGGAVMPGVVVVSPGPGVVGIGVGAVGGSLGPAPSQSTKSGKLHFWLATSK
jgi:hypothetical protein